MTSFEAYRLFDTGGKPDGRLVTMETEQLSPGNLLIRTSYASVNYKDALAAHGRNKIIRQYPRIGGIDIIGTVAESGDARFKAGDAVIVHGFSVGVDHDGGYAHYARVPADWALPLPAGLTQKDAAVVGVAGYTAALSIHLMELNGLTPAAGKIAVNGATGGVASIAINMLAGRGYCVSAITGKTGEGDYLTTIGASEVLSRDAAAAGKRPLEEPRWAGAVDSLGGAALDGLIRTTQPQGVIAAFGNVAGAALNTNVLPFILRGVRLIGVNANSPMPLRRQVWERIAGELKPRHLAAIAQEIRLEQLPETFERLLQAQGRGRYVVALA